MPSELDDLVLSQGSTNKPRGLTFDDVPMILNRPTDTLLKHGTFRPLVERLASVEPTATTTRRGYDTTWRDDLAALLTSDPGLSSRRVEPGSIPRSSALGPWNLFAGPENPDRPSYMMEPTLQEQLEGGIPRERLGRETYGDVNGVVRYKDTGQPVPIVARPGLLPLVATPEGVKVALPRLIDWILLGSGAASVPAQAPRAVRVGAQAAGARAAHSVVDVARDRLQASDFTPQQSLSANFYPPPRVRRDFSADYPNGATVNDKGQLLVDMDGHSLLDAKRIIGRQTLGGPDKALRRREVDSLVEDLTGELPFRVPAWRMNGAVGFTHQRNGRPEGIWHAEGLSPQDELDVLAHEIGHALTIHDRNKLSQLAQPQTVQDELLRVYDNLNNPSPDRLKYPKPRDEHVHPFFTGYPPHQWADEFFAEAARAYLRFPGWFKSVAPETAKILRQVVRENPELRQHIRLNSLAPSIGGSADAATAGAGALGGSQEEETNTGG